MGRKPAGPPPMSFADWQAQCCPPVQLSAQHVSEWVGVSVMTISNDVKAGRLVREGGQFDTSNATNREWLLDKVGYVKRELQSPGRTPKTPRAVAPRTTAPPPPPAAGGADELDWQVVLDAIESADMSRISAQGVAKLAKIETAAKTRVEREIKRGQYIDRSLVSVVFARLYQIDTNEYLTMGAKIAPKIAAITGVESPEALLQMEKLVYDESLKVLAHIKRVMDDFLAKNGAECTTGAA